MREIWTKQHNKPYGNSYLQGPLPIMNHTKTPRISPKPCTFRLPGADLGHRGRTPPLPQEFDPLPTQRVPLCTILRYPYLVTDPKHFLKAPLAPIYTYFEGERVPKKRLIWSVVKTLPVAQKIWPKQGLCCALGELGKSIRSI